MITNGQKINFALTGTLDWGWGITVKGPLFYTSVMVLLESAEVFFTESFSNTYFETKF